MLKSLTRPMALLGWALTVMLAIAFQLPASSTVVSLPPPVSEAALIATAPTPPALEPAILNGEPIHVLYITRSADTVLVRCYPGYEPTLSVRAMGNHPTGGGQQEGVLNCVPSES